jgi:hypothetical protein
VLLPLLEVSPELTIPGIGAASAWLAHCQDQPISRIADATTIRLAVGSVVPPARL